MGNIGVEQNPPLDEQIGWDSERPVEQVAVRENAYVLRRVYSMGSPVDFDNGFRSEYSKRPSRSSQAWTIACGRDRHARHVIRKSYPRAPNRLKTQEDPHAARLDEV